MMGWMKKGFELEAYEKARVVRFLGCVPRQVL